MWVENSEEDGTADISEDGEGFILERAKRKASKEEDTWAKSNNEQSMYHGDWETNVLQGVGEEGGDQTFAGGERNTYTLYLID